MFLTPYQTTTLRRFNTARIVDALQREVIQGQITKLSDPYPEVYILVGDHPSQRSIPQFDQVMALPMRNGKPEYVIDLRPYRTEALHYIELDKSIPIGPASVLMSQAELQTIWALDENKRLRLAGLTDLPIFVFCHWLGETLVRRFHLGEQMALKVITICAWYWTCLFHDDLPVDQARSYVYASKIARVTYSNVDEVAATIRELGFIKDLEALCAAIRTLPIARTEDVVPGSVITAVSGSWFGSVGAKQQIGVALEHPPTFLAVLRNAVQGAGYRKTAIMDVALRFDKRGKFEAFHSAYQGVLAIGD